MKANELRIGNLIMKDGEVFQSTEYTPLIMVRYGERFDPIPLTEEWLLKFGFEKVKVIWFLNHYGFCLWFDGNDWCVMYNAMKNNIVCYLKHVHQLQNLYFILTGEELTFNEPTL